MPKRRVGMMWTMPPQFEMITLTAGWRMDSSGERPEASRPLSLPSAATAVVQAQGDEACSRMGALSEESRGPLPSKINGPWHQIGFGGK